jgi:hypothetical protein
VPLAVIADMNDHVRLENTADPRRPLSWLLLGWSGSWLPVLLDGVVVGGRAWAWFGVDQVQRQGMDAEWLEDGGGGAAGDVGGAASVETVGRAP